MAVEAFSRVGLYLRYIGYLRESLTVIGLLSRPDKEEVRYAALYYYI